MKNITRNSFLFGITYFLHSTRAEVCKFEQYQKYKDDTLVLRCDHPKYTSICPASLAEFPNIHTLIIADTSLTAIPEGLEKLCKLRTITLISNTLLLDFKNLEKATRITHLTIKNSGLPTLALDITYLETLRTLRLQGNDFHFLPKEIKNLKNLETLDISENKLSKLPDEIGELYKLKNLYLDSNKLKDLPFGFARLKNLALLSMVLNKFESIPSVIGLLEKLNTLHLSYNRITSLTSNDLLIDAFKQYLISNELYFMEQYPDGYDLQQILQAFRKGLFNLDKLEHLLCGNNEITEISSEIEKLKNLHTLVMSKNKIIKVPKELTNCLDLFNINLNNNKITYLPVEFEKYANTNLDLNLSYNCIPEDNSIQGLGTNSIKALNMPMVLIINQQLNINYLTIDTVLRELQNKPVYWNLQKLNEIRLKEISFEGLDMTGKEAKLIWRNIFKHLVFEVDNPLEQKFYEVDSDSTDSIADGNLIKRVQSPREDEFNEMLGVQLSIIGKYVEPIELIKNPLDELSPSFKKRMNRSLKAICRGSNEGDDLRKKNLVKAIFIKFLQHIRDAKNEDDMLTIRNRLTSLCESIIKCSVGQFSGLDQFYRSLYKEENTNLEDQLTFLIKSTIAKIKNEVFHFVLPNNHRQAVHHNVRWEAEFSDILGILPICKDPHSFTIDIPAYKGRILQSFINLFTIEKVCEKISAEINGDKELLSEVYDLLKRLVDKELNNGKEDFENHNTTIERYFTYTGTEYLIKGQLKHSGVERVLIDMKILTQN